MEMSLRNSPFNLMCQRELVMPFVKLIILCRKAWPGATTLQANCRVPIRDWSSFKVADLRCNHCWRACLARTSLSKGRRASILLESRRIPLNSNEVVGAKVLPGATGILSSLKRQRILQRAVRQSDLGGLVTEKKSSRMWITLGIPSLFLINHAGKLVKKIGCRS